MAVVAVSILQLIISGTLFSFLIFMPYYYAFIKQTEDGLKAWVARKDQIKCLDICRKIMDLVFNLLYLGLAILILVVAG